MGRAIFPAELHNVDFINKITKSAWHHDPVDSIKKTILKYIKYCHEMEQRSLSEGEKQGFVVFNILPKTFFFWLFYTN